MLHNFLGPPSAVTSLMLSAQDETILLNWTAPFTLDIPDTDQDITYCVDVVSSTSSATLHSECGITMTMYTYSVASDSSCHDHVITVVPVNVVGRGESNRLQFSREISGAYFIKPILYEPLSNYMGAIMP